MTTSRNSPKSDKWCKHRIATAVGNFIGWRNNNMYEEVHIDGGQADIIFISRSNYVTEVEIKLSQSDWRADGKKPKWKSDRSHVKYFYYAIPETMKPDIPKGLPDHAGIMVIRRGDIADVLEVIKPPKMIKAVKLDENAIRYFHKCYYHRYMERLMRSRNSTFRYERRVQP